MRTPGAMLGHECGSEAVRGLRTPQPKQPQSVPRTHTPPWNQDRGGGDTDAPWFHGLITRSEAEGRIMEAGAPEGCFLVRQSGTKLGRLCLSVWYDFHFNHILVPIARNGDYYLVHEGHSFRSMADLIRFYQTTGQVILGENGRVAALKAPCTRPDLRGRTSPEPAPAVSAASAPDTVDSGEPSLPTDAGVSVPVRADADAEDSYSCAPLASTASRDSRGSNNTMQERTAVSRAMQAATWQLADAQRRGGGAQDLSMSRGNVLAALGRSNSHGHAGPSRSMAEQEYINTGRHAFDFRKATLAMAKDDVDTLSERIPSSAMPRAMCDSTLPLVDGLGGSFSSDPGPICSPASASPRSAVSGDRAPSSIMRLFEAPQAGARRVWRRLSRGSSIDPTQYRPLESFSAPTTPNGAAGLKPTGKSGRNLFTRQRSMPAASVESLTSGCCARQRSHSANGVQEMDFLWESDEDMHHDHTCEHHSSYQRHVSRHRHAMAHSHHRQGAPACAHACTGVEVTVTPLPSLPPASYGTRREEDAMLAADMVAILEAL